MKRGKKKINFSNRFIFFLVTLGILGILAVGVYALTPGTAPNPGHDISSISPPAGCSANQYLQFDGTNWKCATVTVGAPSQWTTSSSNIYYNNGNVGIGTSSPGSTLSVGGNGLAPGSQYSGSPGATIFGQNSNGYGIYGIGSGVGVYGKGYTGIQGETNSPIGVGVFGVSDSSHNYASGSLGNGYYGVYSSGAIYATTCLYYNKGANSLGSCSSDERLKTNISSFTFDNSLYKIDNLNLVTFNYNNLSKSDITSTAIGLIAQEVQKYAPELVGTDNLTGYLNVNYGNIQWLMLEGMQQQDKIIYEQNKTINKLQTAICKLDKTNSTGIC